MSSNALSLRRPPDRGEGPIGYLAALLLIALITAALLLAGIGGSVTRYVGAAVCKVAEDGGLDVHCEPPGPPGVPPVIDPYAPGRPCLVHSDNHYLEESITIPTKRIDIRTSSRGTMQLNKYIGPDGKPYWEVVDFTWGEGGVASPDIPLGNDQVNFRLGVWGGVLITNGKIYRFDNEREALDFYRQLEEHRIGNDLKFTVRTNPITGGLVWLGTRLPWVGDDFDDWIGGSEPDRPPSGEYLDGGLTGGFKGEVALWKLKFPFKGRGWVVQGTQTDTATGETTTYFNQRGELELAAQIDLSDIWRVLPRGARQRAAAGMDDALEAAMDLIEQRFRGEFGRDFRLSLNDRSQMQAAIKLNPSGGLNYKHRTGTTWAVTEDKDGNVVRVTKIENTQHILYFRIDGRARGDNGAGDRGELTAGRQWILLARRTLAESTLNYSDPEDRRIIEEYLRTGDDGLLDGYFEQGGGTRSRIVFDVSGNTSKLDTRGSAQARRRTISGVFELGEEWETHTVTEAQYYKPGVGWVNWEVCR